MYTTPAINTFFSGSTTLADFETFDKVEMVLSVTTTVIEQTLNCISAPQCKVTYDWNYTPILQYMIPSVVYPGMTASVGVDPKWAPDYKHPNQLPVDLRIDGQSMDLSALYNETSTLTKS